MGLIRGIAEAVIEKARVEMKDYLIKFIESEKETKSETEPEASKKTIIQADEVKVEEKLEIAEKKEIFPLIEKEFVKFLYKSKPELITIPRELADVMQQLPMEEFACFTKLLIFVQDQKKNFGYLGNSLKKKIGLDGLTPEEFETLISNLESYGLIEVEQVSDNQKTFILFIPFNEETMVVSEMSKTEKIEKNQKSLKKKPVSKNSEENEKQIKTSEEKTDKDDEIPGKHQTGMEDDEMYKSYRTFVSLEIDKAKMRVGRSNFDKIYMEAVKYIDKKYGFKVLSDSEKFKEHLTNYYISAFDIKSFDEWKKRKG